MQGGRGCGGCQLPEQLTAGHLVVWLHRTHVCARSWKFTLTAASVAVRWKRVQMHRAGRGTKQLLLARVALGKVHDYGADTEPSLTAPPAGCDSVSGTDHDMR